MRIEKKIVTSIEKIQGRRKMLLAFSRRAVFINSIIQVFIGVVLIVVSVSVWATFKVKNGQGGYSFYNLHIGLIVGVSFLLFSMYVLKSFYKQNRSYERELDIYINKLKSFESQLIVTDSFIHYSNELFSQEIKWKYFDRYKEVDGLILLIIGNNYLDSLVLDSTDFTSEEFDEIRRTINQKIG